VPLGAEAPAFFLLQVLLEKCWSKTIFLTIQQKGNKIILKNNQEKG
jgi:hypothetical protein